MATKKEVEELREEVNRLTIQNTQMLIALEFVCAMKEYFKPSWFDFGGQLFIDTTLEQIRKTNKKDLVK